MICLALLFVGNVLTRIDPQRIDVDGLVQRVGIGGELLAADLA